MAEDKRDYPVGYGRPPQASRFKPGRSGNPKGRPKGSKNLPALLEAELDARIAVTENGKRCAIPKRQALIKQLVNKALGGDLKAASIVLNETRETAAGVGAPDSMTPAHGPKDELVIASMIRRIQAAEPEEVALPTARQASAEDGELGPDTPAAASL